MLWPIRWRKRDRLLAVCSVIDDRLVRLAECVERYPRLFHMASAGAWPMIQRHGLRSVTAILDLVYYDPDKRAAIESRRRLDTARIVDPEIGDFEIRGQKPLHLGKLDRCLTGMSVTEWLRLLNRKVFFWPTEERVRELLEAREYRARDQLVLVIRTASLVAIYEPEITLAHINTGAVLYDPPARGPETLRPIAGYPFEESRRRRGPRKAIAEVAVDYAVPDIVNHIVGVERRRPGHPPELLATQLTPAPQ
jgi:hypothetical protein